MSLSECNSCGAKYPSAPLGTVHKCGKCENGRCFPITLKTENPILSQVGGQHYKRLPIQPVEYIHANGIGYFEGSVIKYVSRWQDKGGLQDLEKAKHFIELLIEFERKREQGNEGVQPEGEARDSASQPHLFRLVNGQVPPEG